MSKCEGNFIGVKMSILITQNIDVKDMVNFHKTEKEHNFGKPISYCFFKLLNKFMKILVTIGIIVGASFTGAFTANSRSKKPFLKRTLLYGSGQSPAPVVDDAKLIRNLALVGHVSSGKTTLAEWMLYDEHIQDKLPIAGKSSLDSDPVEASRHSSLFSHFMRIPHKNHLLEVADTPFGDFPTDAYSALDGADSAVIVVSAADGIQTNTLNAFEHCSKNGIQTLLALNKMDRPFLDSEKVLEEIQEVLKITPVQLQLHDGEGEDFQGVQPLIVLDESGKARRNHADNLNEAWEVLTEAVAMTDDDLLIEYLENGMLEDDTTIVSLRRAILQQKILPVVFTSAINDIGVAELMDAIVSVLPDPLESREQTLKMVHSAAGEEDDTIPGEEGGFTARVIHTTIDSFGSLSVIRIISNSRNKETGRFESLPNDIVNLRTGDTLKLSSTCFGLCGKQRQALTDDDQLLPGDVIALPKLPASVQTNDIICSKSAVSVEEHEIEIESLTEILSPLSRHIPSISLMSSATVSLSDGGKGKKAKQKSGAGDDKLINALTALAREDLAMKVEQNSGQWIVRCMSKDHLNLLVERLKDRYDVEVDVGDAPVAYRETIAKAVHNVEGKHKKQSGGSGQFGVCYISIEPLEEGAGVEFVSTVKGGAISKPFINSVEKGVLEQLKIGGPLGFPVTDVRVTVTDGKMHSVDSKDIAFQSAGRQAVRNALEKSGTVLLQPMEKVKFIINENLQGEISGIVSRSDGYVLDSRLKENYQAEVEAIIPAASISEVSETLRAESKGEGQYVTQFSHYQTVPEQKVKSICEKLKP